MCHASSSEQAPPVRMTNAADDTVHLPQSGFSAAGGFGLYQLSLAATHSFCLFTILQHVLVRVFDPASEHLPVISFSCKCHQRPRPRNLPVHVSSPSALRAAPPRRSIHHPQQPVPDQEHVICLYQQRLHCRLLAPAAARTARQPCSVRLCLAGPRSCSTAQSMQALALMQPSACRRSYSPAALPPPTCLSVRITSRPLVLQPTAPLHNEL